VASETDGPVSHMVTHATVVSYTFWQWCKHVQISRKDEPGETSLNKRVQNCRSYGLSCGCCTLMNRQLERTDRRAMSAWNI